MPRISPRARNILIILFSLIGVASCMLWWTFRVRVEWTIGEYKEVAPLFKNTLIETDALTHSPLMWSREYPDSESSRFFNSPRIRADLKRELDDFPEYRDRWGAIENWRIENLADQREYALT